MPRTVVEVAADTSLDEALAQWFHDAVLVVIHDGQDPPAWRMLAAGELYRLIREHGAGRPAGGATVGDLVAGVRTVPTVRTSHDPIPSGGALQLTPDGAPLAWVESPDDFVEEPVEDAAEDDDVIDIADDERVTALPRRTRGGLFGARGRGVPPTADPPASRGPAAGRPRRGIDLPRTAPGDGPSGPVTATPGPGVDPRSSDTVTAHALVEAPDEAPPASEVDVVVGLATERQPGVTGSGLRLPRPATRGERIKLTVQIAAAGCELPQGNLRRILVDVDAVDRATTSFVVVTPAVDEPTDVMLQIDYSVDEQLVGKAWRALRVRPPATPARVGAPPAPGQTAVDVRPRSPVDLTIKVLRGDSDDELLWLATSPLEGVTVPEHQVSSRLAADDARAFALDQIAKAEKAVPALVEQTLTGMARTIARAIPQPIWDVLDQVWRAARDEGRDRPSVLVATSEAWVPWELASTEAEFIPDTTLLDPEAPPVLGCQVRMGRWVQPGFASAAGMSHTDLPPPSELALSTMAVVHGSYGKSFDFAELPEAQAECDHLAASYPSVRLEAGLEPMLALLNERLDLPSDRQAPVDVIHIASHGKVDKLDPLRNGIVLSDDVTRLGEQVVGGGSLRNGQPLVFVNACQLATASTDLLGNQGGLAAAFLSIGARGYIAPLWSVEDVVARGFAEEVHRLCLEEGVPVGEAVRRARSRFVDDPTSATPLAYVYYGHPDLVMTTD